MDKDYFKYPRLYMPDAALAEGGRIALDSGQVNYLGNVLRRKDGDFVRVFNGKDGEWIGALQDISRKSGMLALKGQIRLQPSAEARVHLLFAPLKKNRMDIIIEKCTELGVTDFHPVITNRTEVRDINEARLSAQIAEAAEQSERLSIPALHAPVKLDLKITQWKETDFIAGCIERQDAPPISSLGCQNAYAFLIGPVGGFDDGEREMMLAAPRVKAYSLGPNVLRSETACMVCVASALLNGEK